MGLISAFDRMWGVLHSCNRSLRPAYFDSAWEDLLFEVEIDTDSGWIFKNSDELQAAFECFVSVAHSMRSSQR